MVSSKRIRRALAQIRHVYSDLVKMIESSSKSKMRMHGIISTVFVLVAVSFSPVRSLPNFIQYGCKTPQYAELGQRYVIKCHIPLNFKGVYWYNLSLSDEDTNPIVAYTSKDMDKMGTQYLDGTMDITANGSLIIDHVTIYHNTELKVVIISDNDHIISSKVSVVVFVKPKQSHPVIGTCDDKVCYQHFSESMLITCYVKTARPPAELSWIRQLHSEQQPMNPRENIEQKNDGTFDTFVTLKIEKEEGELLGLFVCRSYWKPDKLHQSSSVLIDFSENVHDVYEHRPVALVVRKIGVVSCGNTSPAMKLWKKVRDDGSLEVLGWNTVKTTMNTNLDDNIKISIAGQLVFNEMKLENEGTYLCLYDDGTTHRVQNISLTALVPPDPSYPAIRDCKDEGNCTFTGNTGTLECSLSGVKPMADLEWKYESSLPIALTNHRKVVNRRNVFDVVLTVDYEITRTPLCKETLLIVCTTTDPSPHHFQTATQVIILPDGRCETQEKMNLAETRTQLKNEGFYTVRKAVVIIVFPFVALLGVIASYLTGYCWGRHKNGESTDRKEANTQDRDCSGHRQYDAVPKDDKAEVVDLSEGQDDAVPKDDKAEVVDLS